MWTKRSMLALLALPTTSLAVSLIDFPPTVSNLPPSCQSIYTETINGCQPSDFTGSSGCSSGCLSALNALQPQVQSACGSIPNQNNILGAFIIGKGPGAICPNAPAVTSAPTSNAAASSSVGQRSTTTVRNTASSTATLTVVSSTTTASSLVSSGSMKLDTSSMSQSSSSSSSSTSSAAPSSSASPTISSSSSAPTTSAAALTSGTTRTATSTSSAVGNAQTSNGGNHGSGGSPFDSQVNQNTGSTAVLNTRKFMAMMGLVGFAMLLS